MKMRAPRWYAPACLPASLRPSRKPPEASTTGKSGRPANDQRKTPLPPLLSSSRTAPSAPHTNQPSLAVTSRCAIGVGSCWPGGLAGVWVPCGGAVGAQSGDGQSGFLEVLTASGPALHGPPLLGFGDGVLDADPLGGLLVALLLPGGGLFGRRVFAGFLRR